MRFFGWVLVVLLVGCQSNQGQEESSTVTPAAPASRGVSPVAPRVYHVPSNLIAKGYDHAPEGQVPTKFKKIVPKDEPLSRYGNPSAYHVNGKTYEVMRTASGYKTRGLASWYATKFHAKKTSSGEDYDMYSLTAAHKTLPIPTYVKVKNLENGKEAIIKVNDRGPFHEERLLDLSYGSAVKLGVFPKGTALVEIEALTTPGGQGHVASFYVQAGAFNSEALANALRDKLANLTPSPVFIEQHEGRFIVRVGPFATKDMTEDLKRTLNRNGVAGSFSILV